jgi:hypothetical protein
MRPIGHETAREERDNHIASVDERLAEAWAHCLDRVDNFTIDDSYDETFTAATQLLAPLRPSLMDLHRFLVLTPHHTSPRNDLLGIFITAGYQLLPQETIVYDLETPHLHNLGRNLYGKHLVIDGSVGASVGELMIGTLTINGMAGSWAGALMVGTLDVCGNAGYHVGEGMYGCNQGVWNVSPSGRALFQRAIMNPRKLSYDDLYQSLYRRYG